MNCATSSSVVGCGTALQAEAQLVGALRYKQ